MSELEGLRRRVEAAEERFRFISKVQRADGERLIELLNRLKEEINTHKAESERYKSEVERLTARNAELSELLNTLLDSIETFGGQNAMADFEDRIEAMLSAGAVTEGTTPKMKSVIDRVEEPAASPEVPEAREPDPVGADAKSQAKAMTEPEELDVTETANPDQNQPEVEKIPSFFLRRDNEGRDKLIVRRGSRSG